ncbi:hypothetical protein ACFLZ7_01600 [Nanoarchaeota archaeon]
MSLINLWKKGIKKLDWKDMGLIKLSVAGFILMIAKLWAPLLNLAWYWYGLIFVLAAIRPFNKAYLK